MDDHIDPELDRPLGHRGGEGIITDGQNAAPPGEFGHRLEIDDPQQRIGRRLEPDHPRLVAYGFFERLGAGQIGVSEAQPRRAFANIGEQAVGAAVQIVESDHVIAGIEKLQNRGRSRHPRGEGVAGGAAFEIGDAALEGHAGRILAARIFIALVDARALLDVGRSGVDRRHDGAGRRIRRLPGVDRPGGYTGPVFPWRLGIAHFSAFRNCPRK